MPDTVVIANPAAANGRAARRLPALRDAFAAQGIDDLRLTTARGDEARVVREAIADGATTLVLVGGDGTWNGGATAVLADGATERVRLAFLAAGTGNDFAKALDAPATDPVAMASLVRAAPAETRVDVGVVESGAATHWFLNVAGFGFDAAVLEHLAGRGGRGGTASYVGAALRRLVTYPGFAFTESGSHGRSHVAMMLTFSNGANLGGAFRIAPAARVDDGLLDEVLVGDVQGIARIPLFVRALRGTHINHPKVRAARRANFALTFTDPPACDLDGELVQLPTRDVTVRVAPHALRVLSGR